MKEDQLSIYTFKIGGNGIASKGIVGDDGKDDKDMSSSINNEL